MLNPWVIESVDWDDPCLVGPWVGSWSQARHVKDGTVLVMLDVFYPIPYTGRRGWIRSFMAPNRDACIEAFGRWLDCANGGQRVRGAQ